MVLEFVLVTEEKDRMNMSVRTQWWYPKGEKFTHFKDVMIKKSSWNVNDEINIMRNKMPSCIREVTKEILGQSKGNRLSSKENWWQNERV